MSSYRKPHPDNWTGRKSGNALYLHEKVECTAIEDTGSHPSQKTIAILGYACDEGVRRNQGRIGAAEGPDAIRKQLGKMPNHLSPEVRLIDVGSVECPDGDMEAAQNSLSEKIVDLLSARTIPIVLGGGHDIAYGHYNGIKKHLGSPASIGIINFDAHFDLRDDENGNNSGTPFYQIAQNNASEGHPLNYLCLGIRRDANDSQLFQTAEKFGVDYVESEGFNTSSWASIEKILRQFIDEMDHLYVTIDMDGFSSAYVPGVSAPSPMGFSPDIVLKCLKTFIESGKLISLDIAEMNPTYDIDSHTAKLAASLTHYALHSMTGK
ncbi:formimidoylglutamase [Pricia sp. S334]|uniref:Formimidoylglutamase n=1 Tax=Pricia mediterranea TaxID=3076079 RepID=A0ABU3L6M2_9FLAO|nr:formimidoylglutamase [Pricia sp. S334]MDT7829401.1 formimidoylglutamase [Pricia sp. S334]